MRGWSKIGFLLMKTQIRTDQLVQFSFNALTQRQQNYFLLQKKHLSKQVQGALPRVLMVIDAYLYSQGRTLTIKALNSEVELNFLLNELIAFIYQHIEDELINLYTLSRYIISLFVQISNQVNVTLKIPSLSKRVMSNEVQVLIKLAAPINEERLIYYQGWTFEDKRGTILDLEGVAFIRDAYGNEAFDKLYSALKKTCRKSEKETALTHCKHFRGLLEYFIKLAPTFEELENYLTRKNAVYYLSVMFNVELKRTISRGADGTAFCVAWQSKMRLYDICFVAYGVFPEPLFPLPIPKFKDSISLPGSHNKLEYKQGKGSKSSGVFNKKLITKIPLEYTDKEAIREITQDIRRDIGHVLHVNAKAISHNYKKLLRFKEYKELSSYKELGEYRYGKSISETRNTACATFAHYLWDHPGKEGGYSTFLGFANRTDYLTKLFCIPTMHVLYPLLLQLVYEHPKITDSWLLNWQLYDENGNVSGIVKSGSKTIVRSVKKRKGAAEAGKPFSLNDKSQEIVDKILEHTEIARGYLKSENNDDYRFVLITASLTAKPSKVNNITNLKKITSKSFFTRLLNSKSPNVSKDRAREVASLLTINRMRASTGVEVFLKTNSVKQMCEALGHKDVRDDLVCRYLPEPILRYFKDRWIRIFQNALVYEAMKDSRYLHKAIDITPESLEEFLSNHRLKSFSEHVRNGNVIPFNTENPEKREGAIVLSVPLLRILLFFFNASREDIANIELSPSILETWIQLSTVIITQIEFLVNSTEGLDVEFGEGVIDFYREALSKPLSVESFLRGVVNESS